MSLALILALTWIVIANLIGLIPSRHAHWPQAYGLIAVGCPLLIWLAVSEPWFITLGVALMAASVLRWPIRYAVRWLTSLRDRAV